MHQGGLTQTQAILAHLHAAPITPLEALEKYRCFRLAARIKDLRRLGHPIESDLIRVNGKVYARYSLPKGQLSLFQTKAPVVEVHRGLSFAEAASAGGASAS